MFSDEIVFAEEEKFDDQSDRIWFRALPESCANVSYRQTSESVMFWTGINSTGKTPLLVTEKGGENQSKLLSKESSDKCI